MQKKLATIIIFVLVVSGSLLLACSPQQRIGWIGSETGNQIQYRYSTFTGVERATVQAAADQEIIVDYAVTADKGTLTVALIGPEENVLWEESFQENAEGEVSIAPMEDGGHEIVVEGQGAGGSFDISWEVME